MLEGKTFSTSSQPFCSAKACSHIASRASHARKRAAGRSRGDGADYARTAASSQAQHPPATQPRQRNVPLYLTCCLVNHRTPVFPVIHCALLVCGVLVFPPNLLRIAHSAIRARRKTWSGPRDVSLHSRSAAVGGAVGGVSDFWQLMNSFKKHSHFLQWVHTKG